MRAALAALALLATMLATSSARAGYEPETSDYPFTLEQAASATLDAWLSDLTEIETPPETP